MAKWDLSNMTKSEQILSRLRKKLEVMHRDFQTSGNARKHDIAEMLDLVDILERELPDGGKAL